MALLPFLLWFPSTALAAHGPEHTEQAFLAMAATVTVAECRNLPAPPAFSMRLADAHRAWHQERGHHDLPSLTWDGMHRTFHEQERKKRFAYTQRIAACSHLLHAQAERHAARTELFAIRWARGILLPARLVLTGGGFRHGAAGIPGGSQDASIGWLDERFRTFPPTRRSIVRRAMIEQENRRLFE